MNYAINFRSTERVFNFANFRTNKVLPECFALLLSRYFTGLCTWNWKTNHSLSLLTFCKKRFDFEPAISFHFSSHPPFFSLFQVLQHGQPQTSSLKSEERRSVSWGAARKPASKRIGPENREERTPGRVDKSEWQVQIGRFLILSAFDRAVIHFLVFICANMISA